MCEDPSLDNQNFCKVAYSESICNATIPTSRKREEIGKSYEGDEPASLVNNKSINFQKNSKGEDQHLDLLYDLHISAHAHFFLEDWYQYKHK